MSEELKGKFHGLFDEYKLIGETISTNPDDTKDRDWLANQLLELFEGYAKEREERLLWRLRGKQVSSSKMPNMQVVGVGYIIQELKSLEKKGEIV